MRCIRVGCCLLTLFMCVRAVAADKPVPPLQVLPLPHDQASFARGDQELARYHYGRALRRPFIYPLVGPAGSCAKVNEVAHISI